MKTIVIAAGRSTRTQPIADKNFIEFCGEPLIKRQFDNMVKSGLDDFILVGGAHNLEKLKAFADEYPKPTQVVEQTDLDMGMAGAMLSVKHLLTEDEPILIAGTNDVVDDQAFKLVLDASKNEEYDCFLIGKVVEEYFPGGYLSLGHDSQIEHIIEKPGEGNEPSNLVNLVIHYHRNPMLFCEYLEEAKSSKDDLFEVALARMMADGVRMQAVEYSGFWQALKYPWHVFPIADYFFDRMEGGVSEDAFVADSAVIKGNVVIEAGAKIFEGAIVNGPAYIGKNTIVANNALVRSSYVGANCVVGYSTEIARSMVGNDVWTHMNYIGDSIIGNNCSFGSGTVTGNLRLDEKTIPVNCGDARVDSGLNKFGLITGDGVRCGINTSFMPGVKVGRDSFVGAGIVVAKDVPNGMFVRGTAEVKMTPNTATLDEKAREEMKRKMEG